MNQLPVSPVKGKKKKRSFLDDDDFFVKKKPRAKTPTSSQASHTAQPPSTQTVAPVQQPHPPPPEMHSNPPLSVDGDVSENASLTYHSANESFHELDAADLSVLPPNTGVLRAKEPPVVVESDNADDSGFLDPDLQEFVSGLAKKNTALALAHQHDRIYRLKVTSRLGLPLEYEKEISGETTFAQLLEILLQDTLREHNQPDYWTRGVLVWIEGRLELKPFFRPSTLRLPQAPGHLPTQISCLYIPPEHVHNFESLYAEFDEAGSINEQAQPNEATHAKEAATEVPSGPEVVVLLDASDDENDAETASAQPVEKSQYFVIGLKGKDNKRIEAEVGPATKIRNLLKYYMQVKGIKETPGRPGRILFEDEQLDLDAVVGDTELEEDFEVQVHI
ncbi:hypothetical protein METBIDRAFT_41830 [Metschnikowia bicuspidata var. bicuspidata NRRL YB-4993]|uniref:Rad60/SUMO-like domain-containing protein n=1 Tax=Metschnikowia bicuspidata var. bicuspidata NRRL YB-4993 TaxID=869754 RepID=A0A1A0HC44_9ASCO|nr:hypothetical protein METBIDRAFT_41830 [Metschnikowia bicuspidata var. bicuspidata NRRL YB-4993]OBA21581.1 hypothetical protein METBIDRAFT_41830 [Metschnikowia bicuspidata var. bicuspidata NRRL YB-4993]